MELRCSQEGSSHVSIVPEGAVISQLRAEVAKSSDQAMLCSLAPVLHPVLSGGAAGECNPPPPPPSAPF